MAIFNFVLFNELLLSFVVLIFISGITAVVLLKLKKKVIAENDDIIGDDKNPLEFKVALMFTLLYVAFTFVTYYTINYFGIPGLNILSLLVGVTDIDPFLINLFQGKLAVTGNVLALATLQAIISNNVVKALYAYFLAGKKIRKAVIAGFVVVIIVNIILAVIVSSF